MARFGRTLRPDPVRILAAKVAATRLQAASDAADVAESLGTTLEIDGGDASSTRPAGIEIDGGTA